ncbi:MAG: hypothetical protein ACLFVO_29750 [Chloroflexaceae bacterium]
MTHMLLLVISTIWAATLIIHTRRLFRLAKVEQLQRDLRFRVGLNRIWWWLGQDQFWQDVHMDGVRAIQLTLSIFLVAWGLNL